MRLRPGILGLVLILALAACGNDDDEVQEPAGEGTDPPVVETDPPAEPEPDPEPEPTPEPEPDPEVYEVQQGDTLWAIAERFGVSVDAIVEANDIEDPSRIFPGDELVIPPGG